MQGYYFPWKAGFQKSADAEYVRDDKPSQTDVSPESNCFKGKHQYKNISPTSSEVIKSCADRTKIDAF